MYYSLLQGRTQAQGSQGSELLLGWPGLHLQVIEKFPLFLRQIQPFIQVLRGDHDRHPPRRDHPRPQDQLDVRRGAEAQGAAWTDCRRQELSRPWQGTQVQPDQGRKQARQLAEEEQPEAEEEAIDCDSFAEYFSLVQNIVQGPEIYFQIE